MIVTVTLNPSVDEEYILDAPMKGEWIRASSTIRMPGGRGIDVALMLTELGFSAVAMGFLAGFNGEYIRDALRRANVTTNFVHIDGETRTNVYIVSKGSHEGKSIFERGPEISENARKNFLMNYRRMLNRASAVVLAGAMPLGLPKDIYRTLSRLAKDAGLPVYLDAYGSAFVQALETQPYMAKVPDTLVEYFTGRSDDSLESFVLAARKVHEMGVPWSVISYKDFNDIYVTSQGTYMAGIDSHDDTKSLFMTQDAFMTGMVIAGNEGMSVEETIRFSIACAYENSTHRDKSFGGRDEIERLMKLVKVEKLD